MKQHELKTNPGPFQSIWEGKKKAELRFDNGRGFEVDDQLLLKEHDAENGIFSGRRLIVLVTHITLVNAWIEEVPKDDRWVVMSFEELFRYDQNELEREVKSPEGGGIRRK